MKRTRKQLLSLIDKSRREYVQKRDQDWREKAFCISCGAYRPVEELQVGHYFSRVHDFSTELGGCKENTNLQCVPCNHYKRGNIQGYALGLVRKYGKVSLEELEEAKKTKKRWTIKELESLLEKYKKP